MGFLQLKSELTDTGFNFFLEFNEAFEKDLFDREFNLEQLFSRKELVLDFRKKFPKSTSKNKYDSKHDLIYIDKNGNQQREPYNGGCRQFIEDVNIQIENYIKFLDSYISVEIHKKRPKKFPLFGNWNDLDNPQYFILKKGSLGCIAEYFHYINNSNYPDDMDIYRKLHTLLYKKRDAQYSLTSFKSAKDRHNETRKNKCFKRGFNKDSCIEFLNYFITFKLNQ